MAQYQQDDEVGMGTGSLAPGHAEAPGPFHTYDIGGPFQLSPAAPPIVNPGVDPAAHPMEHIGQLIKDHASIIRQRLLSAHQQRGLAPHDPSFNPLQIIPKQTAASDFSNLAALLAKWHQANGAGQL